MHQLMNENQNRSVRASRGREKKGKIVTALSQKLEKAKALIFTNYQGMTHKQIEGLKKSLKGLDADLVVTKNTLLTRALEDEKWKIEDKKSFEGPTATLFVYADVITPIKELAKSIKSLKLPVVKFGILDKQALTADQVLKLASLPSREMLLAQIVGQMKAPIFGLQRALNWNLQKLVMNLKAIESKKASS